MPAYLICLDLSFAALALYLLRKVLQRSRPLAPLPPGPKGLPLIGNALDMPKEQEWFTFAEWGKKYGPICSITILGQTIVVINSLAHARALLERRSPIYSDRPSLEMGGNLVGWRNTLVLLPYGERFRVFRKMFHQVIGSKNAMSRFEEVEEHETKKFLKRLLSKPEEFAAHVRHTAGAIILKISHGYEVKEQNDPFVELADRATEQFSLSTAPGGWLVDVIPALKHLPTWLPGTAFLITAREWASTLSLMVDQPFELVKDQMKEGTAPESFTSQLLHTDEKQNKIDSSSKDEEEFNIKWAAASLYSGGADTTVSAIHSFFLAMALHPAVLSKARAEIDQVCGGDRLPTFADRDNLRYVDALVKEVLRWHAVVPTGVPHRVTKEDITEEGYRIPEGALVITNTWHMLNDPEVYPNPEVFDPERFMGERPQPDPREICFGFGRRICPGLHLADASIFISCAMTLAVFDISKRLNEEGDIIEPTHECTTGTISHTKPFECTIKPRSNKAVALVMGEHF